MANYADEENPLAADTGPFYDEPDCAQWLGIEVNALKTMADELRVLRPVTGDGTPVYPIWQFTNDRQVIPHLGEVLRALACGTRDPWTWAQWLTAPGDEDDRRTAWERLATNDAAEVIRQAHEDGARWAT
jgi:hypothetical protein